MAHPVNEIEGKPVLTRSFEEHEKLLMAYSLKKNKDAGYTFVYVV